jgi:hypothetical protein
MPVRASMVTCLQRLSACRSQGTLSDLLRNPKPWNKLKSGRETFRRMYNWVQQTLPQRLAILDLWKEGDDTGPSSRPNTPTNGSASHVLQQQQHSAATATSNSARRVDGASTAAQSQQQQQSAGKRPRLVFTDIQKRTLQAIFKETQRPSREMQQTIAEHLRLDLSTVANFFMNARRRSRCGPLNQDEPAPYQQIRPITPPPDSPPPRSNASRQRAPKPTAPALMPHIEESVAAVAEEAVEYARKRPPSSAAFVDTCSDDYDDDEDASEPEVKVVRIASNDSSSANANASNITRIDNNLGVVGVTSSAGDGSTTGATQRRSLPVMSFGKTVTVKVEREVAAANASTPSSDNVDD